MQKLITMLALLGSASLNSAPWAEETLERMSLREKIAQLCVATIGTESVLAAWGLKKFPNVSPEHITALIQDYHVGGILFLGEDTIAHQCALTRVYQELSTVPLLVLEDLEWGANTRLVDALNLPRAVTVGACYDDSLVYEYAKEIGRQCRALGVHVNLAPVLDVNNNPLNPVIGRRSFGADPERVAHLGKIFIQGLHDAGVLACAKHFPGHGDTEVDSHYALPVLVHDCARLDAIELVPFKAAIAVGVDAVMPAHMLVPVLDAQASGTISFPIVTSLLKDELGFTGLVVTDALFMGALDTIPVGELEVRALCAGNDLLIGSLDIPRAIDAIESAVYTGRITHARIDASVLKLLRVKERAHWLPVDAPEVALHAPSVAALKKQLYRAAITVVRDQENLLPIIAGAVQAVQIGQAPDARFMRELMHVGVPVHQVSAQMSVHEMQDALMHCTAHTLVVGLFDIAKSARYRQFGIADTTLQFLQTLSEAGKRVILVVFGTPYCLSLFGDVGTVIMAYEDDPDVQSAAVERLISIGSRYNNRLSILF